VWNYTLIYEKWTTYCIVNADFRVIFIQKQVFALKSKDVKRQYPVMLSRFFDFIKIEKGETFKVLYRIFATVVHGKKYHNNYDGNNVICFHNFFNFCYNRRLFSTRKSTTRRIYSPTGMGF
jgi:hypothetical protein